MASPAASIPREGLWRNRSGTAGAAGGTTPQSRTGASTGSSGSARTAAENGSGGGSGRQLPVPVAAAERLHLSTGASSTLRSMACTSQMSASVGVAALPLARTGVASSTKAQPTSSAGGLRTGEDAIAYFLEHGGGARAQKFLHLKHRYGVDSTVFRPYDLVVVAESDIDSVEEHFIMSARGIAHLQPTAIGSSGVARTTQNSKYQPSTTRRAPSTTRRAQSPHGRGLGTTASPNAVDRAAPNASDGGDHMVASEFLTLPEWARHASCFNVCTSLRVFRDYLRYKAFSTWVANVRFNRYCEKRASVEKRLFAWRPSFHGALGGVMFEACQLLDVPLFDTTGTAHHGNHSGGEAGGAAGRAHGGGSLASGSGGDAASKRGSAGGGDPASTIGGGVGLSRSLVAAGGICRFTLPSFLEAQFAARVDAIKAIERIFGGVTQALERLCGAVSARAHPPPDADEDWAFGGGAQLAPPRPTAGGRQGTPAASTAPSSRGRSMAADKAAAAARVARLRAAVLDEEELGPMLRVLDARLVESTAAHCVAQARLLLGELAHPGPQRASVGMFHTSVMLQPGGGVELSPSSEEVAGALTEVLGELARSLNGLPRLLYAPVFRQYTSGLFTQSGRTGVFGALTVAAVLEQSDELAAIAQELAQRITADYTAAREYARVFDTVRPIYEQQQSQLPGAAKQAETSTPSGEPASQPLTLASLQRDMVRLRSWAGALERMRSQHIIGGLYVDSRSLKASLEPVVGAGIAEVTASLTSLTRDGCKRATEQLHARAATCSAPRPRELADFLAYTAAVERLRETEPAVLADVSSVEEMYRSLGAYDVRISSEESVALDDLRGALAAYRGAFEDAEAWVDETRAIRLAEMEQAAAEENLLAEQGIVEDEAEAAEDGGEEP